jgi:transposase
MRAISKEKRELLIEAKERGETIREIALWLGISSSSVALIWKQYKTRGHVRPTKNKGRPPRLGKEGTDRIESEVVRSPDITLEELIEKLSLPIKKSQVSRLLIRLGYTFKKNAPSKEPAKGRRKAEAGGVVRGKKSAGKRQPGLP